VVSTLEPGGVTIAGYADGPVIRIPFTGGNAYFLELPRNLSLPGGAPHKPQYLIIGTLGPAAGRTTPVYQQHDPSFSYQTAYLLAL